jgi:hypothetical protein
MLNKITAISTAILATASALTQSKSWNALDQLARFDNIPGVPVLAVGPINEYLDIYWQGMSLVETGGIQNIAIISANSPSNYAAFSALDTATATQGQPSMMANYPDSTIDHFDLKSFASFRRGSTSGMHHYDQGICGRQCAEAHGNPVLLL